MPNSKARPTGVLQPFLASTPITDTIYPWSTLTSQNLEPQQRVSVLGVRHAELKLFPTFLPRFHTVGLCIITSKWARPSIHETSQRVHPFYLHPSPGYRTLRAAPGSMRDCGHGEGLGCHPILHCGCARF